MTELTGLYDCARLARDLGISRKAADAIMRQLPTDDEGLVRGDHVSRLLDDYMVPHTPTSVYFARDASGKLLYVGITGSGTRRLHAHSKASKWWTKAAVLTLEHYETRDEAERREAEAIAQEQPRFNISPGVTPKAKPRDLAPDVYRAYLAEAVR